MPTGFYIPDDFTNIPNNYMYVTGTVWEPYLYVCKRCKKRIVKNKDEICDECKKEEVLY